MVEFDRGTFDLKFISNLKGDPYTRPRNGGTRSVFAEWRERASKIGHRRNWSKTGVYLAPSDLPWTFLRLDCLLPNVAKIWQQGSLLWHRAIGAEDPAFFLLACLARLSWWNLPLYSNVWTKIKELPGDNDIVASCSCSVSFPFLLLK